MNKFLISAAIVALAAPAWAAGPATAVQGAVSVNGAVAPRCQFTGPGSATINIPELSAAATGELDPATVNGQSATLSGFCNGVGSTMTADATSLVNATTALTGFSNQVDFAASATANSQTATDASSTDATPGSPATVGIFSGDIAVALANAATHGGPTLKLVAGPYVGRVVVTLTPGD